MRLRLIGAFYLIGCWLVVGSAAAQDPARGFDDLGAYRDTLDMLHPQPFRLRPFIMPGTAAVYLDGTRLDTTAYRLDERHGRLWVDGLVGDPRRTLVAVYRTWGFTFSDEYRRRTLARSDTTSADATGAMTTVVEEAVTRATRESDAFSNVQLQQSGSISRGVLVGNNRDATIESGLRLQIEGQVAEGVNVQAVLTDESTPILPEGTTQRLNEFDRVFIQIDTRQGTAQLGDFDVHFDQGTFARFSRKLQGITVFGDVPPTSSVLAGGRVAVAGATARGVFQTQDLDVDDGVQGPYRLLGKNNEQFIIVIPGSEQVYVDGVLMTRGETNDYVIDYATGEITFTSNRLIREDNRVTVEFQYRTTEFTRTLVGTQADVSLWQRADGHGRARFGVTFLREADSRNFSEEFGLTAEDEDLIAAIGDSTAERTGARQVDFDPEAPFVQYVRRDTTLADGVVDTFFVALDAAPADTTPVYQVQFTRVGQGNGSYVREGRTVNGILYVYKGPGRGEYAPVRLLPKPKQQRLLDLRGGFEVFKGGEVFGEWAQSLNDENRLSSADAANDVGHAYHGGFRLQPISLSFGETDLGSVSGEVSRRFTGDRFTSFDRTRPVEFARRWNLDARTVNQGGSIVQSGDETIDEARLVWDVTKTSNLQAEVGRIRLSDTFEGKRQAVSLQAGEQRLPRFSYQLEYIQSDDALQREDGTWLRQRGRIEQPLLKDRLVPHFEVEQERRRLRVAGTDSLAAPSLAFVEYRPGVTWQTEKVEVGGIVEVRTEDQWADGVLRDAARAWTLESHFKVQPSKVLDTEGNIGYRIRRFTDFFRIEKQQQNRESVVLQWNGRFRPIRQAVNVNWLYEALTERTPTQQEIYINTGPELGEFVWEDSNGDGIIQIDEFIPERTQDEGTYVRTYIPSDSLQSIIGVQARLTLQLEPGRIWRNPSERWKKILAGVTTRTTLQIQEKSRDPNLAEIYLLNLSRYRDPQNTLKGTLRFGQDVFLFRNQPRYGLDLSLNQIRSLNELAAGTEERFVNQWRMDGTLKPANRWGLRLTSSLERNKTDSENFASRRFDIESVNMEPEVSFAPSSSVQLALSVAFSQKDDAVGDRKATVWKVPLSVRYTLVRRFNLTGRFEVADVTLESREQAVGLANFELTDGRGIGTSYLWTVTGWYQLSRLLRATLSYNGRAPSDAPTVHTVRVQLSAVF